TSYDADNRPSLVMRSNLWASGYDVDGTDQTSLGQFSGRVQQTYKHSVPRFFVPEHGTMFTLVLATDNNTVGGKRTSARVNIVPCSGTKKRGTECLWSVEHDQKTGLTTFGQFHQHHSQMPRD